MKTVILDRCTIIKDGDVSFDPITSVSDTEVYDMLTHDEMLSVLADADAVICNKAVIDADIIEKCKSLKYVGLFATGYNNIDLESANKHGVYVANTPGYSTCSVAQHTIGLMLTLAGSISRYNSSVHSGDWCRSAAFTYLTEPMCEVSGKTLGIFGFGEIGRAVAKVAEALGMKILVSSRTEKRDGYTYVSRDELFKKSDFLTLHCPLTDHTKEVVNKETLSLMKPTAFIINTSRGGVINENDLCDALERGIISGAAIDVATTEPMRESDPLLKAPNLIITPHVAWATYEARSRLVKLVGDNLKAFVEGRPQNIVNRPEGVN